MTDASALVEGLNDWRIAQWLPTVPFPYREADAIDFINLASSQGKHLSLHRAYVIADGETGEFLGVVGLSRNEDTAELGYWLLPGKQGKGVMTEAVEQLLTARDAPLSSVFATVDPGNTPSIRVLEKAGFRFTGDHRRPTPNRQGHLVVLRYQRDFEDEWRHGR